MALKTIEENMAWVFDPKNKSCDHGKKFIKHFKNIKDYYDNLPDTTFLIFSAVKRRPALAFSIMCQCLQNLLPAPQNQDLIDACTTLYDKHASREEILKQIESLDRLKTTSVKYTHYEYQRIVYHLLRYRAGLTAAEVMINLQQKMCTAMVANGCLNSRQKLLNYMRSIYPFEMWGERVEEPNDPNRV